MPRWNAPTTFGAIQARRRLACRVQQGSALCLRVSSQSARSALFHGKSSAGVFCFTKFLQPVLENSTILFH